MAAAISDGYIIKDSMFCARSPSGQYLVVGLSLHTFRMLDLFNGYEMFTSIELPDYYIHQVTNSGICILHKACEHWWKYFQLLPNGEIIPFHNKPFKGEVGENVTFSQDFTKYIKYQQNQIMCDVDISGVIYNNILPIDDATKFSWIDYFIDNIIIFTIGYDTYDTYVIILNGDRCKQFKVIENAIAKPKIMTASNDIMIMSRSKYPLGEYPYNVKFNLDDNMITSFTAECSIELKHELFKIGHIGVVTSHSYGYKVNYFRSRVKGAIHKPTSQN